MKKIVSLWPIRLNEINKLDLIIYFENTWALYNILFRTIIDEEAFYIKPDPLRHPLIFYLGHTAAFYINKLKQAKLINKSINPDYEQLFEKGVDPASATELNQISFSWPSVNSVWQYRDIVHAFIVNWLQSVSLDEPITSQHPLWAFIMALEHDRIHFETSSVLIRQVPVEKLLRPEGWVYAPTNPAIKKSHDLMTIPATTVELGKKHHDLYGWDNEYGQLLLKVPEFKIGKNLITNCDYQWFVEDSGYEQKQYWSAPGWEWRTTTHSHLPKFWLKKAEGYYYRALFNEIEMPWNWPVEVNYYEAEAFCRWLGESYQIMSEAEFMAVVQHFGLREPYKNSKDYNANLEYGSPTPVGFFSSSLNKHSVNDMYGNVWQWLSNDFYPFPGFKPHPYYLDFSAPFFNKDHGMLRGGSWASTGTSGLSEYRLWFRRNFFQHAGFRVCYRASKDV